MKRLQAAKRAEDATARVAESPSADRQRWLRGIAAALREDAGELVALAMGEARLDETRLRGEMVRTTSQLEFFAEVLADGAYLEVMIDHARPEAAPPLPDLRRMLRPVGPAAVFAASNFPFAFSVAGGDTASALAAGCPVVVKASPGHPETSRRTADTVTEALRSTGAPDGAFGLIDGFEEGISLVGDPAIRAVAFTGSLRGGRVIHELCAARPDPIPFYGELGSLNPVVVTPGADEVRGDELAAGLSASFTLGVGQFCTKPGLVLVPVGSELERALPRHLDETSREMLNSGIAHSFRRGLRTILAVNGVEVIHGAFEEGGDTASPVVVATDVATLLTRADILLEEVFGPATVLARYESLSEAVKVLERLGGSLTATIHAEPGENVGDLVTIAGQVAGRVLFRGWPTGVSVTWAQHHGGPWPATTSTHTSVGASAIRRFLRPLVFQDAPTDALPPELLDDNPLRIPRRIDGIFERGGAAL
jgi:NADP-dependent aldehyde dehydrogenase